MSALTTQDLATFEKLGIGPDLLDKAGIERVTDAEAREICRLVGQGDLGGIVFPYFLPGNGDHAVYCRVRRDHPEVGDDGRPQRKYLAPAKTDTIAPHPYFPPAPELVNDATVPIVLVESEKAVLALTAWSARTGRKILAIGLGGAWGWSMVIGQKEIKGEKQDVHGLHPDLAAICRNRKTYLLFDANAATSADVQKARQRLTAELRNAGSLPHVLDLPSLPGVNGPDDYIGIAGDQALTDLFNDQKTGCAVLADVEQFLRRYLVMSDAQFVAVTLWTAHTHAIEVCTYTPYLAITSAEKQSAKSQLLRYLVRRPWNCSGASAAVLFRKIAAIQPTLLLDEMDAILQGDKEMAQAIRGILNAGNEADAVVSRCEGKGAAITAQDYSVFCPKALAGIGSLPETVRDRSIPIRMVRKPTSQKVAKLRKRLVQAEGHQLRERLANWIGGQISRLRDAFPVMPEELSDRQQDGAEILLAIAEAAGGDWPARTRKALLELFRSVDVGDDSNRMRMLTDLREIYNQFPLADAFSTSELLEKLKDIETSPWSDWSRGRGLTAKGLSDLLKPFGIFPGRHMDKGVRNSGYRRTDLEDAWSRYLPPIPLTPQNNPATVAGVNVDAGAEAIFNPATDTQLPGLKSEVSANKDAGLTRVAGLIPGVQGQAPEATPKNRVNGTATLPEPATLVVRLPIEGNDMRPFLQAAQVELTDDDARLISYGRPPDLRPGRAGDVGMADDENRRRRDRSRARRGAR